MKTHCVHGHPYTPDNTLVTRQGSYQCRACSRQRRHRRTFDPPPPWPSEALGEAALSQGTGSQGQVAPRVGRQHRVVTKRRESTLSCLEGVRRLIVAVGRRIANREVDGLELDDLRAFLDLHKLVEEQAGLVVARLREQGMSDAEIGQLVGLKSRQAVQRRWKRREQAAGTDEEGEGDGRT